MIYGNPSKKHIDIVQQSIILQEWQDILTPLLQLSYPCEITTRAELLSLVQKQQTVSTDDVAYANFVDEHLFDAWEIYITSFGYTASSSQVQQWTAPFEPIIDYLKLHYNRPRPFQMAGLWNIPLYPLVEYGSTDSSYPSGHTLFSLFIYHKLVEVYPQEKRHWLRMVCDVSETRMELGVHYPSDILVSFQIYQALQPHITKYYMGYPT